MKVNLQSLPVVVADNELLYDSFPVLLAFANPKTLLHNSCITSESEEDSSLSDGDDDDAIDLRKYLSIFDSYFLR